jgi:hypothetical protein
VNNRLGDQRGEWMGADKNSSRRSNSAYAPNSQSRILTRVCQGHVVTTDLPTSAPCPRTVREQQVPRTKFAVSRRTVRPTCGRSGTPTWTVRQTTCSKTLTARRIYMWTRKNWTNMPKTQTARTVHSVRADGPLGTNRTARASNCEANLSYPSMDFPNGLSSWGRFGEDLKRPK